MLPSQIFNKLVEIVLSDIAKNFLSRQHDQRRKFAESMLSYYLSIKEYRSLCKEMLSILERNGKVLDNRRLWPSDTKRLQEISDKMSVIVGKLFWVFESEWDGRDYLITKHYAEAQKRHSVLEIYDKELAQLVSLSNYGDYSMGYLIKQLSKQSILFEEQVFRLVEPTATVSAELLWEVTQDHGSKERAVIPEGYRIIDLTNQDDYQRLLDLIRDYSTLLDELVVKTANFIKENFKIDEIL